MKLLGNRYGRALSIVLALQAVLLYTTVSRAEYVPSIRPLADFPLAMAGWRSVEDIPIDQEDLDVLKADDTLNRAYVNSSQTDTAYLFIAFFKTQRTGQSPHSPKNCLPGNGWEPVETGFIPIAVPGRPRPILANRYVTVHGYDKSVTIYWYQSRNRIIASEYAAKFWLVADSIRYHRSDTSLVRVIVPVRNNDTAGATREGVAFVQAIFPSLVKQLPS
ncbi:MAG TPA: EpsI family protein [Bryobacteraceae bacterium]|nr:EpsI family protein [Bryobacteraceae bacterium]